MRAEAIDALIAEICQAAIDDQAWRRVVAQLAADDPGIGVAVALRRTKLVPEIYVHAGYPPGAMEEFIATHSVSCPWNDVQRDSRAGVPYAIEDVMPLASITYSRFYRDWLVAHGIGGGFGVKICDALDCSASFLIHCSAEMAAQRKPEFLDLLSRLTPHLRRSVEFSRRLVTTWDSGLQAGIRRAAQAVMVIEGSTTVLQTNAAMDDIVARGLCALSPGRKLRLHKPDDTARLAAVLLEAMRGRRTLPWPHVMAFEVPGQTGPNVLEIAPLERTDDALIPRASSPFGGISSPRPFVVTMRVRSLLRGPSAEHIRVGLGLTPKQAEAVWSLVNGESIEKQAQDRGLSVDGVRWHFKNIYQRTGCSTQAELVRLVISLFQPAPL